MDLRYNADMDENQRKPYQFGLKRLFLLTAIAGLSALCGKVLYSNRPSAPTPSFVFGLVCPLLWLLVLMLVVELSTRKR